MKTKATKKLVTSLVAIMICFSMLIGTTFAWFTDSTSSGSNVIVSGNLDINVEYTLDGENWSDLEGATDMFQKGLAGNFRPVAFQLHLHAAGHELHPLFCGDERGPGLREALIIGCAVELNLHCYSPNWRRSFSGG